MLLAAAALLTILGSLANVYVSMALRARDREDFESLRDEYREDQKAAQLLREKLLERIAKLEPRE
jgi:hypothetical protein